MADNKTAFGKAERRSLPGHILEGKISVCVFDSTAIGFRDPAHGC